MDEIARYPAPEPMTKESAPAPGATLKKLLQLYPEVQLATLVEEPPQGKEWLHENKFDGYRLLGFVAGGALSLRTRNGKDWTAKFPSLAASLEKLKVQNAVLDMEAVVVTDTGKSNFQALQAALGEGGNPNSIVAYVFDVLYLNGRDLTKLPLRKRKERLQTLLNKTKSAAALRYGEHSKGNAEEIFAKACRMGLEGIVSKQAEAPYLPGRQRSWLKSKCTQRQVSQWRVPGPSRLTSKLSQPENPSSRGRRLADCRHASGSPFTGSSPCCCARLTLPSGRRMGSCGIHPSRVCGRTRMLTT
jgi:bifunctional non-homologous end joining protein LigD